MSGLLDDLEREARQRSNGLEAIGKLPAGFTAKHYPLTAREQRELRRLQGAAHAASNADTFVALCKGLPVPGALLNKELVDYKRRIDDVRG